MPSLRDQIKASKDDFRTETVTVPEWGDVKLVMRELNVHDRGKAILSEVERVEVAGGFQFVPKLGDPDSAAWLVVASAHDEAGERVFEDSDVEWLAAKSATVVDRLAEIVKRLTPGLGKPEKGDESAHEGLTDAGKESSETPPGSDSSLSPTT